MKNNIWKKIVLGLIITGLVVTSAACGSNNNASNNNAGNDISTNNVNGGSRKDAGNSDGVTTLTFWNGFTAADGEILRDIVNEFNETNDKNIYVEMDIMPWANFNEMLPPAITSGTAPDFALMIRRDLAQYVQNGALKPMDFFWDFEGVDKAEFSEASLKMGTLNDIQYSIPMQVQSVYLYWNKDLFEAAGLDPEKPPVTWDDLYEIAPKLVNKESNVSGFVLAYNNNEILYNLILANGGNVLNADFTESVIDSEQNAAVLEKIQNLIINEKTGPATIVEGDMFNLMNAGQLGMVIAGPFLVSGLQTNEINFGITTIPQVSVNGSKYATLEGVGFVIPASTDSVKTDAIYEFVSYWNSTEVGRRWSLEAGFPPYLSTVAEDPEIADNPIVSELMEQIGFAEPFMTEFPMRRALDSDIISPMVERLMLGEDAADLLREASEQINNMMK